MEESAVNKERDVVKAFVDAIRALPKARQLHVGETLRTLGEECAGLIAVNDFARLEERILGLIQFTMPLRSLEDGLAASVRATKPPRVRTPKTTLAQ